MTNVKVRDNDPLTCASIEKARHIRAWEPDDDGFFLYQSKTLEDLMAVAHDLSNVMFEPRSDYTAWHGEDYLKKVWRWIAEPIEMLRPHADAMINHDVLSNETPRAKPEADQHLRSNSI